MALGRDESGGHDRFRILMVRQSRAQGLQQRLFIALLVPSIYATGATIGNGQLVIHILPFLITALSLVQDTQKQDGEYCLPSG